jgi:hypothetical protein
MKGHCVANYADSVMKLNDEEIEWMTPEVLWIFYRARATDGERQSIIKKALNWRIAHRSILCGQEARCCNACQENSRSHDARLFGEDADGDHVFMNCFALPRNLAPSAITAHMACLFERALREVPAKSSTGGLNPPHVRKWSWVIDLYGFGFRHLDPRTSIRLLELMQVAYRGRLKHMLIVDAPVMFWGLWRAVKSFIKPATADLIEFVEWGPAAVARYRELFGNDISDQLLAEGRENRDTEARAKKKWTTFYAGAALERASIYG